MEDNVLQDLVGALRALGYKVGEARGRATRALSHLGPHATLGALVKEALKKPEEPSSEPQEPLEEEGEGEETEEVFEESQEPEEALEEEPEPEPSKCLSVRRRSFRRDEVWRRRKPHFHFIYFLLVGWWLTVVVVVLRLGLMGVDALFRRETKREPSVAALFGWWR